MKMAGAVLLALTMGSAAKGDGSFSDLELEFTEAKVTLQGVAEENRLLKAQLAEAQEALKTLTSSLAAANGEAETFRQENAELKLRMEALGVDGLSADRRKLEQRLLKAVGDLQIVQREKEALADQLVAFAEAVLRYTKGAATEDAEARMEVEAGLRKIGEALGIPGGEPNGKVAESLGNGTVISIKEELSLVVANIGNLQGVKVGMPFRVVRDGREIATVRAVDVREKICGAVIQSLDIEKNKIKVGDRLKVDAR